MVLGKFEYYNRRAKFIFNLKNKNKKNLCYENALRKDLMLYVHN